MPNILVSAIIPNPQQPRTRIDENELESLALSMSSPLGQLIPIMVENDGGDIYTLVDGERRWRAAQRLGWLEIDAIVRPLSNHAGTERLIQAFVANDQRSDMSSMDYARTYKIMLEELGSVEKVYRMTGKSSGTIYPYLALNDFEPEIQALFERKALTVTSRVVAALKRLPDDQRVRLALRAATRGVSEPIMLAMIKRFASNHGLSGPIPRNDHIQERSLVSGEHFDAMALVPQKIIAVQVVDATKETCRKCELYGMADKTTCRQCPLVDFLRRL